MADESQSLPPAPESEHQTLVLTNPPPQKHHLILWSVGVVAVALVTGGIVFAYWQFSTPASEVPVTPEKVTGMTGIIRTNNGFSFELPPFWIARSLAFTGTDRTTVGDGAQDITLFNRGGEEVGNLYCRRSYNMTFAETELLFSASRTFTKDDEPYTIAYGEYAAYDGGSTEAHMVVELTSEFNRTELNSSDLSERDFNKPCALYANDYGDSYRLTQEDLLGLRHIFYSWKVATTTSQNFGRYDISSGYYFDGLGKKSAYSQKSEKVYFREDKAIESVDLLTFSVLCGGASDTLAMAKDTKYVYYQDRVLVGADPATFQVFYYPADDYFESGCEIYTKDKNHVFYYDQIVSDQPATFSKLSWNTNLWTDGQYIFNSWGEALSDDAPHFVSVDIKESKYLYAKDTKSFYRSSTQSEQIDPIENSDPASFQFLTDDKGTNSLYARDNNIVYSFAESLGYPGPNLWTTEGDKSDPFYINPATVSLALNARGEKVSCAITAGSRAFLQGFNEVPDVDVISFVVTDENCMFAKDKNRSYRVALERDGEVLPQ